MDDNGRDNDTLPPPTSLPTTKRKAITAADENAGRAPLLHSNSEQAWRRAAACSVNKQRRGISENGNIALLISMWFKHESMKSKMVSEQACLYSWQNINDSGSGSSVFNV